MSRFIDTYKTTGNSITAYMEIENCCDLSIETICNRSFEYLEDVFVDVDFFTSDETKIGFLKNTGKLLGGLVSLGGSYVLQMHEKHYSDIYEALYEPAYNELKKIEEETNKNLLAIGEKITQLRDLLKPIGKLINNDLEITPLNPELSHQLDRFNSGFNSSTSAGFGGLVGGTTAIGAWGLVSLIGSASTGTAISSLSGIAATNATLAWFGGGSLAAGGAGMAGGFWVLGGITLIPAVYLSTKGSYSKAEEVKSKKEELIIETEKIIKIKESAYIQLSQTRKKREDIILILNDYIPKIKWELYQFKNSKPLIMRLLKTKMNTAQKNHYNNITKLTSNLLKNFDFNDL